MSKFTKKIIYSTLSIFPSVPFQKYWVLFHFIQQNNLCKISSLYIIESKLHISSSPFCHLIHKINQFRFQSLPLVLYSNRKLGKQQSDNKITSNKITKKLRQAIKVTPYISVVHSLLPYNPYSDRIFEIWGNIVCGAGIVFRKYPHVQACTGFLFRKHRFFLVILTHVTARKMYNIRSHWWPCF